MAIPPQPLASCKSKATVYLAKFGICIKMDFAVQCNILCCAVQLSEVQCAVKYTLTTHCRDSEVKFIEYKYYSVQCIVSVLQDIQCVLNCRVVTCSAVCSAV